MASIALPPFLEKLRRIAKSVDPEIAGWSEDGTQFEVHSNRFEKEILRTHFRGNRQTFIRQLHFYCFKKLDNKGEMWAFSHPKFRRDAPHLIYEIKRKTRTENGGPASKLEVHSIRAELDSVSTSLQAEIDSLKILVTQLQENIENHVCCNCGGSCNSEKRKLKDGQKDTYPDQNIMNCQSAEQEPVKKPKKLKDPNYSWDEQVNISTLPFSQALPFDDYTSDLLDGSLLF